MRARGPNGWRGAAPGRAVTLVALLEKRQRAGQRVAVSAAHESFGSQAAAANYYKPALVVPPIVLLLLPKQRRHT